MRIKWLDGLKGLACFAVLWHHFILGFLPGQYNGTMGRIGIIDPVQSPLSFIVNGNFMVALFMLASGMAAALSVMNMKDKKRIFPMIPKRYLRLMLPVVPVALAVWAFSQLGWFSTTATSLYTGSGYMAGWYSVPVELTDAIRSAVFTSWYKTDTVVSGVFWVFPYFLWGYFLAMTMSLLAWKKNRATIWIYIAITAVIGYYNSYYMAFAMGVLIVFAFREIKWLAGGSIFIRVLSVVCLVAGLVLGGYPSGVAPTNLYAHLPDLSRFGIIGYIFWHVIGSALVMIGLWNLKWAQRLLEHKFMQTLGTISYEVFLVHMIVVCSLTCIVFRWILTLTANYILSVAIAFIATNVVVYYVSYGYHKLIEMKK